MSTSKIRNGLIPACITFGPLFMTRIGGSINVGENSMPFIGTLMLSAGLIMMFQMLCELAIELRTKTDNSN